MIIVSGLLSKVLNLSTRMPRFSIMLTWWHTIEVMPLKRSEFLKRKSLSNLSMKLRLTWWRISLSRTNQKPKLVVYSYRLRESLEAWLISKKMKSLNLDHLQMKWLTWLEKTTRGRSLSDYVMNMVILKSHVKC